MCRGDSNQIDKRHEGLVESQPVEGEEDCGKEETASAVEVSSPCLLPSIPHDIETRPQPVRAVAARLKLLFNDPAWTAFLPSPLQPECAGARVGMVQGEDSAVPSCGNHQEYMPAGDVVYSNPLNFQDAQLEPSENYGCCCTDDVYGSALQPSPYLVYDGVNYPMMYIAPWHVGGDSDMFFIDPMTQSDPYIGDPQQCLAEYLPQAQVVLPAGLKPGSIWKLSREANGCRKVQEAFDIAENDEQRLALASELIGHVWDAVKCPNANHVLQKSITMIGADASQFVIDELVRRGPGLVEQAARHRFGCRVIERLLEHCSKEQTAPIVEEILAVAVPLSEHIYGNYVIQHLFEHADQIFVERLMATLVEYFAFMAADGYLGSVLDKALTVNSTNHCRNGLVNAIVSDHNRLWALACSRWGHDAAKQALNLAEDSTRNAACQFLSWHSSSLRKNRYGKNIAGFAAGMLQLSVRAC